MFNKNFNIIVTKGAVLGGEIIEFMVYRFIKANPARPLNNDIKFEFVNCLIFIIILVKE